ncbi:hypothetical protein ACRYLV_12840, partial [Escherichia coli]
MTRFEAIKQGHIKIVDISIVCNFTVDKCELNPAYVIKNIDSYRSGELILTHFSGEPLAAHTIDHRLTMVDLFCCTGTIAGQVPAAGS